MSEFLTEMQPILQLALEVVLAMLVSFAAAVVFNIIAMRLINRRIDHKESDALIEVSLGVMACFFMAASYLFTGEIWSALIRSIFYLALIVGTWMDRKSKRIAEDSK